MHMVFHLAVIGEDVLLGYGPLGVAVLSMGAALAYLSRIILKDRDKAIADREAMLADFLDKILPALMRSTDVLEKRQVLDLELIEAIKQSNTLREETRLAFEGSKRSFEEVRRILEVLKRMIEDRGGNTRVGGM